VDAVVSADVHETPAADGFRSSRRRVPAVCRSVPDARAGADEKLERALDRMLRRSV